MNGIARVMTMVVGVALVAPVATPAGAQTTEERNRATFAAMVEAIDSRDLDRLDALMAEDLMRHSQATPGVAVTSLAEMKAFLRDDFATVPDSRQECPMVVAEGEFVAAWCTYSGTQQGPMGPFPATGEPFTLDFAGFLRFEDGKIAEMWVTWDNLAALTQLGHFPAPDGAPVGDADKKPNPKEKGAR